MSTKKPVNREASTVMLSEKDNNLLLNQMSLDLFCGPESDTDTDTDTTRSLRIYDLAPKYCYNGAMTLLSKATTATFTRDFNIKDQKFKVTVNAATIKEKDGKEYLVFPSNSEELVEAALRKMAISGGAFNHNGSLGARFSIYGLQQELAKYGHKASYDQIKRSIMILRRSSLGITDTKTGITWEENFFPQLGIGGWQNKPGAEYDQWFVSFHKLVTDNIITLQYRDMSYPELMRTKGLLGRHILQRMVTLYTFASPTDPYRPSRNQILMESGRGMDAPSKRLTERVARTINQLQAGDVVSTWEVERKEKQGRSITNLMYAIYPTKRLISEIIKANDAHNYRIRKRSRAQLKEIQSTL